MTGEDWKICDWDWDEIEQGPLDGVLTGHSLEFSGRLRV